MAGRIEDYAVVGDLQTAALVGRDGSVDWLCLPRFDSPSCFAALLGDEESGRWRIAPAGHGAATHRRYRGDSLVLESEWETPGGTVRLLDLMPPRGATADLVRIVEGVSGSVEMAMDLRLRFDYGDVVPWVRREDGLLSAVAGPDAVWLATGVPLEGRGASTVSRFRVAAGDRATFVLAHGRSYESRPPIVGAGRALGETERFWQGWIDRCSYDGRWPEAVHRSLVTLKALTHLPTGGVVAAATTSLPELPGGLRNWDYRYCWLRDAAFTLQALLGTGFVDEARAWREWLLRAVAGDPADLQIMYGVDGARRLPEWTVDWLPGYEGSGPVRVGNAAYDQLQLDVYGETLDALHLAREAGLPADADAWNLQKVLLEHLEGSWRDLDNGLWEVRGDRRAFVHSRVMSWVAFDRAVRAVEDHGVDGPADRWRALRDEVHAEVCARGYDADRNTFTQSYGASALDAALLLIPRVGFLPPSDPRVVGTVEAVQRELCRDGFLLRYDPEHPESGDGLPGREGAFLACSFWLVDALADIGRTGEAEEMFERLLAVRNDVGLLAEMYDPVAGRQLGNTPQAFSHVGLVNSARLLSGATTHTSAGAGEQRTQAGAPG